MTSGDAAPIHEDWTAVARKDWQRLHRNLRDGDAEAEQAARLIRTLFPGEPDADTS